MSEWLLPGGVALGLFLLSYVRPGRFGPSLLAFGAGFLLAGLWADKLAGYEIIGFAALSEKPIIYGGLIVLPGLFTLLLGQKQKSLIPRFFAAAGIALFVVTLLLPVLDPALLGQPPLSELREYRDGIITGLLLIGLLDTVFSRPPKAARRSKD